MGVICASNGGPFYRNIVQPISIGTLLIIILMFIVTGSLGIQLFNDEESSKRDFCINYVQYPETFTVDYEAAFIVTLVVAIIVFILSLLAFWKAVGMYKYEEGITVFAFPTSLLVLSILLFIITGAVFYEKYKNKTVPTTLRPNIDGLIVNWCTERDTKIKNNYIALAVIFTIGMTSLLIYALDFIFKGCIRY